MNMILAHLGKTWPHRKAEWLLAFITAGLGVIYVVNPLLFERPYFDTMSELAPQPVWALVCLGVGFTRLAFLTINGAFRASPQIRFIGAASSFAIWSALTMAAINNDYTGQTLAVWPAFMVFDFLVIRETATEWAAVPRRKLEVPNAVRSD